MELWDAYDGNFSKIDGMTLVRGNEIPDGVFHLVSEIIVRHSDGTYLLMQRKGKHNHMKTREEALNYGLSFPDTYQEAPFHDQNWQLIRVKKSKKAFLWTYEKDGYINLNLKVDPEWRDLWRRTYKSVLPAYHQNKEHWNTVILDGSVPEDVIKRMIAESYDLVTDSPSKKIYEAVKKIPKGKVATYADVAEMAGNRKMARAVGNALHKNPDPSTIPCHRVVNSKGELAGEYAFGGAWKQGQILESEGVEVIDGKVNLEKYRMGYCSDRNAHSAAHFVRK